jgi:hypothetical protein
MPTRPAKERVGLKLPIPRVGALVVEGLHPAIRRPTRMRRPTTLRQLASHTRSSAACSVGVANGFLSFMIVLFLSSTGVIREF